MADGDTASKLAFETDAIRSESRWLKEQAARVTETMDRAHPVMSAAWKRIRELEAREADARHIINAAFGEYACMVKAKLTEEEVTTFENNFAVEARKWLAGQTVN